MSDYNEYLIKRVKFAQWLARTLFQGIFFRAVIQSSIERRRNGLKAHIRAGIHSLFTTKTILMMDWMQEEFEWGIRKCVVSCELSNVKHCIEMRKRIKSEPTPYEPNVFMMCSFERYLYKDLWQNLWSHTSTFIHHLPSLFIFFSFLVSLCWDNYQNILQNEEQSL